MDSSAVEDRELWRCSKATYPTARLGVSVFFILFIVMAFAVSDTQHML
jgi:hypothetical protein